ncbi:Serine/threonine-protein kinase-transforming protein Rmil [Phytophthora ramorum]|uniref:Serine/threonine-protein kinase-transforming protein Rmil n=1 Tax=Phytophthora ramorum TaxID=164328 RepID=UPI00309F13B1|nr:Serine/threonine-protein kinase-transforming protein Rmil [Phytophthora ramorum]
MLAAVAIVTFIYAAMEACVAQDSSTGSLSADNSSSGSWTSSTGSEVGFVPTTTRAEVLAQEWFIVNLFDNETHLAFGVDSKLKNLTDSDIICNGMPSLQRRSAELLPNFGCPDIFTAVDASCTCLGDGYTDTDVWEFRVARRTIRSEYPTALSSADVLPVDAIRTMQVPSTLKTLRIIGGDSALQDIHFAPQDKRTPGTTLPIAVSPNGSLSISTVEITNINMFSITLAASSFLPPTTTNLNLTNNSLTTFPTVVFNVDNLQELYIAQNDITDFNISNASFNAIKSIGTSFWIAPEVLLGRDYDEQADIYSFGVVLSEIDTDDYPYWNDANRDAARGKLQEADILRQVASGTKRPQFSSTCPAGILLLAEKCLQKKPDDRPTASEIVETLQQLLRSSLLPSSSDSSPSFVSGSGWTVS